MYSFIKGLADTDFSLVLRNKPSKISPYYPLVALKCKSLLLINILDNFFNKENIKHIIFLNEEKIDKRTKNKSVIHGIFFNGRKNLELWMKIISFRNPRHLNKYEKYKKSTKSGPCEI